MFCKNCGKEIIEGVAFCKYCGNVINPTPRKSLGKKKWSYVLLAFALLIFVLSEMESAPQTTQIASNDQPQLPPVLLEEPGVYDQKDVTSSIVNIYCKGPGEDADFRGGSGTIFLEDGGILTNEHIIPPDAKVCIVILPDPVTGQAKDYYFARPIVHELSEKYDLAALFIFAAVPADEEYGTQVSEYPRVFPTYKEPAACENVETQLGESIRVFGYPELSGGQSLTVTDGIVSSFPGDGFIVTSANISSGNSGGLAIDSHGCFVGIPSMVSFDETGSLGVIISKGLVREFLEAATAKTDNE
jgi:S1-C subfamily serine protease